MGGEGDKKSEEQMGGKYGMSTCMCRGAGGGWRHGKGIGMEKRVKHGCKISTIHKE